MTNVTHADLVKIAGRWLRNTASCPVVLEELCAATGNGENPDAIGWYTGRSMLIECKVSRSDFLADRKKPFRAEPSRGLGLYRYYMAPRGLLRAAEMPTGWGLLEVSGRRVFLISGYEPKTWHQGRNPWAFERRFHEGEMQMLLSAMARIKVRVGAAEFHSMLHERLMQPAQPQSTHAADTAAACEAVLNKDAA